MDTFAPDFSKFWLGDATNAPADADGNQDAMQENALKELADLVSAARSIV